MIIGYGFADFMHPLDAQKALESLKGEGIDIQFARVSFLSTWAVVPNKSFLW